MDTNTALYCEMTPDMATTTYCYYPTQEYLDYLDYTHITPLIFIGTMIFFIVAFFIYNLFKR